MEKVSGVVESGRLLTGLSNDLMRTAAAPGDMADAEERDEDDAAGEPFPPPDIVLVVDVDEREDGFFGAGYSHDRPRRMQWEHSG